MKMKSLLLFALTIMTLWSCSSDEDSNLLSQDFETGIILSLNQTTNNTIFNDNLNGSLDVDIEYRDAENGNLLDKIDVFVTFFDSTEDAGDNEDAIEGEEVLFRTIEDSDLSISENEFPLLNLVITTEDFLSATNNTLDGIAAGDEFLTRFEVTLTDGRMFSTNNTGSNGGIINTFSISTSVE